MQKNGNIRVLPLKGAYNVRDLGGYSTIKNKKVKWKTVFRSGDLNLLTDEDLKYLASIPINTTIDFRDKAETESTPDKKIPSLKEQYFLPIETGSLVDIPRITPEMTSTVLVDANKFIIRNYQSVYKRFFEILMEKSEPLLFHCSAGKDRAGLGAALFLSSLGVDRESVIKDYLLTNQCLKGKYDAIIQKFPAAAPLLEARTEYIQSAFDEIDTNFGGINQFLQNNLKVDLKRMQELYTE